MIEKVEDYIKKSEVKIKLEKILKKKRSEVRGFSISFIILHQAIMRFIREELK